MRVFDLDTPRNRQGVKELDGRVEILWGDITKPDSVSRAVSDIDAVVHMAAVLPPAVYENPQLAHELLRILYREMKSGALRLSGEGVDADGIIENFPVRLVPLSDEIVQGFAYATIRWNDSEPTVMWQVILPDRNGLFPGDPGVDPAFVRGQDPSSLIDVGPEDDEVSP